MRSRTAPASRRALSREPLSSSRFSASSPCSVIDRPAESSSRWPTAAIVPPTCRSACSASSCRRPPVSAGRRCARSACEAEAALAVDVHREVFRRHPVGERDDQRELRRRDGPRPTFISALIAILRGRAPAAGARHRLREHLGVEQQRPHDAARAVEIVKRAARPVTGRPRAHASARRAGWAKRDLEDLDAAPPARPRPPARTRRRWECAPASPTPLCPAGLRGDGVSRCAISTVGHVERGRQQVVHERRVQRAGRFSSKTSCS